MIRRTLCVWMACAACASPEPSFEDRRAFDHNRAGAEALQRGDLAAAALHFERARELGLALGDRRARADAENNLGITLVAIGRDDEARARFEAALALARPAPGTGDVYGDVHWPGVMASELNLARLATARGDFAAASASLDAAQSAAESWGSKGAKVDVAKQRAATALARDGATDAVVAAAVGALQLAQDLERDAAGLAREADAHLVLGRVRLTRGELDAALAAAERAAVAARSVSDRSLAAASLELLGDTYEAQSRPTAARERYELALEIHARGGDPRRVRAALQSLARLARSEGRADLVASYTARLESLDAVRQAGP